VVSQKWETTEENGNYEFYVKEGEYSILVQATYFELAPWAGSVSEDKKVDFQLMRIDPKRHTYPGKWSPTEAKTMRPD
jgi:hypothetical protein